MSNNTIILTKQKQRMSKRGKYLVVRRIGFPHEGFYIVKVLSINPLNVRVHDTSNINWDRNVFRIAWQETISYSKNPNVFLKKNQNTVHIFTGLKELNVHITSFRNLALQFPFWL